MIGSIFHSYLFAQAFGLYFVIMAFVLLSRGNYYRNKLTQEPSYPSFLSCSLSLLISILLVLSHNIWVLQPRISVTIVCWLFLIRSVLWLLMPEDMFELTKKLCLGKRYYAVVIFMVFIGIGLMAKGSFVILR